ncbi:MAG TPA: nucleotidyltransferase domain-containing protein [Candidatus Lokiarchaeia archaeon]
MSKILACTKERYGILKNFRKYLKNIKSNAIKELKDAQIYLFGSALEDKLVAGSDIDVLIVGDIPRSHLKRVEYAANIEENAGLPMNNPFHIHLIDPEQFKMWMDIYKLKLERI